MDEPSAMLLVIVGGAALMLRQRGDLAPIVAKRTEQLDTPPLTKNGQPDPATTAENNRSPDNKMGQPSPQTAGPQTETGARGSSAGPPESRATRARDAETGLSAFCLRHVRADARLG